MDVVRLTISQLPGQTLDFSFWAIIQQVFCRSSSKLPNARSGICSLPADVLLEREALLGHDVPALFLVSDGRALPPIDGVALLGAAQAAVGVGHPAAAAVQVAHAGPAVAARAHTAVRPAAGHHLRRERTIWLRSLRL